MTARDRLFGAVIQLAARACACADGGGSIAGTEVIPAIEHFLSVAEREPRGNRVAQLLQPSTHGE